MPLQERHVTSAMKIAYKYAQKETVSEEDLHKAFEDSLLSDLNFVYNAFELLEDELNKAGEMANFPNFSTVRDVIHSIIQEKEQ